MRSILLFATVLIFMNTLSAQKRVELGVVSMVNVINEYDYWLEKDQLSNAGYSVGLSGSWFLNDRFAINAALLYSKLNYNFYNGWCGTGVNLSDRYDQFEAFTSVRFMILKNKRINPFISTGFIQGSTSSRSSDSSVHFAYNYGGIGSVGASLLVCNHLSMDIETSARKYFVPFSSNKSQTIFSPALTLNYRIR